MRRALIALVLLVGCAPSGGNPRNRAEAYQPTTGEYRVHYLSPPWELRAAEGTSAFLRVRSNRMNQLRTDGGLGKFELRVSVERGDMASRAAAEASSLMRMGVTVEGPPREVDNDQGVEGLEVLGAMTTPIERSHRVVFFPLPPNRFVRLAFEATPTLDTAEVDSMIGLFEIGPLGP